MRALLALAVIAIAAAATAFLADNPGRVEILWQGWRIDTSLGVVVGAAVLAALAAAFLLWLVSRIVGSPRALLRRRRERRRRAGYAALTRGIVAVAAGDVDEARRHARRAEALLAEPPLTLLLSAQAAQLAGDEAAAKKFFTAMLDRRDTEFLGLRGLFNQALRDGDQRAARGLAERAAALRPDAPWALTARLDLEARAGDWQAARAALAAAAKRRAIPPETVRRHRGVVLFELSRTAAARGDRQQALALAREAQGLTPDLAAPAAHHARLLLTEGRAGRAAAAIERAWRTAPQPELAEVYGEIWRTETPLARMARFQRLAALNPAARDSHLAAAEAALAARLWGEARRHLDRALAAPLPAMADAPANTAGAAPHAIATPESRTGATPRLCRLMAGLEEAEHGDTTAARSWLARAAEALPDPRYVCGRCGSESGEWHSLCPRCGAFDKLDWRTPAWDPPARLLPEAADPARVAIAAALPAADAAGG
jgi:HemY protein